MRVIVADDAVLFREGLSGLLADAGFEVTAKVGDAVAVLDRVTGLRGLEDRVAAMGGDLTVTSPVGEGTSVRARLPC